ncbi:redoxin family protein [Alteromonadaceae bacterium BrNp21-10]|nr:redoxin family protein [Alteromonadaceae bacterium BrNp21-10]
MALLLCSLLLSSYSMANIEYQDPITLLDGKTKQLQSYLGEKPVYLKFWASWCKPCMQQMPHLQHTYEQYADHIEIISVNININETRADIQQVIEKFGLTVPIALDNDGALAKAFQFIGTPYHILLDKAGNVVHKGHDSTAELDRKIALLASQNSGELIPITLTDNMGQQTSLDNLQATDGIVFFSATWCDWYLADTRPKMAKACSDGQLAINKLQQSLPQLHWYGVVSHLWTESKDVAEYVQKFDIAYPVAVDHNGDSFFTHGIRSMPTLIIFKDGNAVFRTADMDDISAIDAAIKQWLM